MAHTVFLFFYFLLIWTDKRQFWENIREYLQLVICSLMSIFQSKIIDYAKAFAKARWSKRFCIYLSLHFLRYFLLSVQGRRGNSDLFSQQYVRALHSSNTCTERRYWTHSVLLYPTTGIWLVLRKYLIW